jgi:hypothetical protein
MGTGSPSTIGSLANPLNAPFRHYPAYVRVRLRYDCFMPIQPESSEEQRVVAEYHIATERYTAAVGELATHRATMSKEDYTKMLHMVEDDARNECERARNALARLHESK